MRESGVTSIGFPRKEEVGSGLGGILDGRSFQNSRENEFKK